MSSASARGPDKPGRAAAIRRVLCVLGTLCGWIFPELNRRARRRRRGAPAIVSSATHQYAATFAFEQLSPRWFNPIMHFKQPRSVQVVIFDDGSQERRYLLLKRVASHGGFWQSVTGSLEGDETHRHAAVRELLEETGVTALEAELIELGVVNNFEIAPQWRERYAPGVTHNEEVCFALKVLECEAQLDSIEHDAYVWVSYERAMEMVYWDSNKRALAATRLLN